MRGDAIVIEEHHIQAANGICEIIFPKIQAGTGKYTVSIAGESGSGKSETAAALANLLAEQNIDCYIFQQDDYFIYPPKTNDRTRRQDITWVGPQEVKLDLLDSHLASFRSGVSTLCKPLVMYAEDTVTEEECVLDKALVAIAEGTYTTLLTNINTRVFIDRSYHQTKAHREKRRRDESELDSFIDNVLQIEHDIITKHKVRAQVVLSANYSVSLCV